MLWFTSMIRYLDKAARLLAEALGAESPLTEIQIRALLERLTAAPPQRVLEIGTSKGGTLYLQRLESLAEGVQKELVSVLRNTAQGFRLICTTTEDLEKLTDEGQFHDNLLIGHRRRHQSIAHAGRLDSDFHQSVWRVRGVLVHAGARHGPEADLFPDDRALMPVAEDSSCSIKDASGFLGPDDYDQVRHQRLAWRRQLHFLHFSGRQERWVATE